MYYPGDNMAGFGIIDVAVGDDDDSVTDSGQPGGSTQDTYFPAARFGFNGVGFEAGTVIDV
jgi:hypothetical protein